MAHGRILVIDDEANIRKTLKMILSSAGYSVELASDGETGLKIVAEKPIDAVLLDIWMPIMDGLETLQQLKKLREDLMVIMISGHGTIETAVKALRRGAYDFLEKPLSKEKTLVALNNALEFSRLKVEHSTLKLQVENRYQMVGTSPVMDQLFQQIQLAAPTKSRVLILGENGTGKELVARAIHKNSKRADGPFVKVNCAAIPEDLIESELFGHEKGSFTGAHVQKDGKFVQADGGTILLDEIGDMTLKTQAKVLRVLQEQELERVGGSETIKVDVRILAATNQDLENKIAHNQFREDLYFRLNVIPIVVPPLRDRADDIEPLVLHFLRMFCEENDIPVKTVSEAAIQAMQQYKWPGNIRELRNQVERLVIMVPRPVIEVSDLPDHIFEQKNIISDAFAGNKTLREVKEWIEKEYIISKLDETGGNVSRAAELLGIERTNLYKKMKAYDLESK